MVTIYADAVSFVDQPVGFHAALKPYQEVTLRQSGMTGLVRQSALRVLWQGGRRW
jgi:hypothetical protein